MEEKLNTPKIENEVVVAKATKPTKSKKVKDQVVVMIEQPTFIDGEKVSKAQEYCTNSRMFMSYLKTHRQLGWEIVKVVDLGDAKFNFKAYRKEIDDLKAARKPKI